LCCASTCIVIVKTLDSAVFKQAIWYTFLQVLLTLHICLLLYTCFYI